MKIILFRGLPGSGKTTISTLVSKETNIPVLRKDDTYDLVSEFVQGYQTRNKISYGTLYAILKTNSKLDCSFIIDFPFNNQEHFSIIKSWCKEYGVELKSILVTCSDEKVWAERFNVRGENPLPNQLITNFEELNKNYNGVIQVTPEPGELVLDALKPSEILLKEIQNFIFT